MNSNASLVFTLIPTKKSAFWSITAKSGSVGIILPKYAKALNLTAIEENVNSYSRTSSYIDKVSLLSKLFDLVFPESIGAFLNTLSNGTIELRIPSDWSFIPFELLSLEKIKFSPLLSRFRVGIVVIGENCAIDIHINDSYRIQGQVLVGNCDDIEKKNGVVSQVDNIRDYKAFSAVESLSNANKLLFTLNNSGVIHLVGHGDFMPHENEVGILSSRNEYISPETIENLSNEIKSVPSLFFSTTCRFSYSDRENYSVAQSFQKMGIPQIVGPCDYINHNISTQVSDYFYHNLLKNKLSVSESLRNAVIKVADKHPDTIDPWLFRLWGDPEFDSEPIFVEKSIFIKQKRKIWILYILLCIITLILMYKIFVVSTPIKPEAIKEKPLGVIIQ